MKIWGFKMHVNKIQNYSSLNPNFHALRLKQNSSRYLMSMPPKVFNKLDSVGEYLANTKFYHLDIGYDDFFISHISSEKFYLPIMVNNAGNTLIIKAKQGATPVTKKLKYSTSNEVSALYDHIKNSSTQLERTAKIVKVLDEYEEKLKQQEQQIVINPAESKEDIINKLLKKYGI